MADYRYTSYSQGQLNTNNYYYSSNKYNHTPVKYQNSSYHSRASPINYIDRRRTSKSLSPPSVGGKFARQRSVTSSPDLDSHYAGGRFCETPAATSLPLPSSWIALPKERKTTELKEIEQQMMMEDNVKSTECTPEKPITITANNFNKVINRQLFPTNAMAYQRCVSITADEISTLHLKSLLNVSA